MITGKNQIAGTFSAEGQQTFRTTDPAADKENPQEFFEATPAETDRAVNLASEAFRIYKKTSGTDRAAFLEAIAARLEASEEDIISCYIRESALPEGRARGEFARTTGQLRAFAVMLREGSWVEAIISNPEGKPDIRRVQCPVGPVAVFGASNFPLAFSTAGGDTASALAAGCPVVVKAHPMHAATGELVALAIADAARETGMPEGVFSHLNGKSLETGQRLVKHPKVKAVGFTGSISGGTALYRLACNREEPIPVYAEMGSVNPVVVLPSALEDKKDFWAAQYAGSITAGTGQFCTNPGLLLGIAGRELDSFTEALGKAIGQKAASCMLHPDIKAQYLKKRDEVLSQPGYSVVTAPEREADGNFALPHVIAADAEVFMKNGVYHQEVFGPFSVVVKCRDKAQLTEVLQHLEGQLTGTVLAEKEQELQEYAPAIDALKERVGRLILNGVPTGVEVCAAMMHGGPFPASTDSKFTSVGLTAVQRWVRPVAYQDWPDALLPDALRNSNPLNIFRNLNGVITKNAV
ncbi:aldehyde dehydrogenase (NADP(+)) [Sinomicrobium soli]|uniref:aldehyde dehydrogenase (NADP(+)) n=1 Tax=Sinomicrobium sp. N-1-3-6 TaxID=2219864 RepID=UPI000DCB3CB9|nr:aldehyde dehydrogenase (NADP(+)) [Sinomicrobium sp. N-1-3-6]RAV27624.1 aldehyde dehydrogenase (NADP(+)) [Sinomicrobium sp. N-1-3-6]